MYEANLLLSTPLLTNMVLPTCVKEILEKSGISQFIKYYRLYLTLSIVKILAWLPYINIIFSICYFFYTLFIIWFNIHGDLSHILIDFNYNYAEDFNLDTDNTVYSSGNSFFDPVRDSAMYNENNPTGPANNPLPATPDTDTTKLANFLQSKAGQAIAKTGIRFSTWGNLSDELKYYSRVTIAVREEHPHMFNSNSSYTRLTKPFLLFIRGLDKNYPLN